MIPDFPVGFIFMRLGVVFCDFLPGQRRRKPIPARNAGSLRRRESVIHHTAYDLNLLGIDADGGDVDRDLLEIHDGPLTKAWQDTDGKRIVSPPFRAHRPNRDFLAQRFEQFLEAT